MYLKLTYLSKGFCNQPYNQDIFVHVLLSSLASRKNFQNAESTVGLGCISDNALCLMYLSWIELAFNATPESRGPFYIYYSRI